MNADYIHLNLTYDPTAEKAITFRMVDGICAHGFVCADIGGKYINITKGQYDLAILDRNALTHEFGHILGFKHAANGKYDFMSYDYWGKIQERHFDVLYKNY